MTTKANGPNKNRHNIQLDDQLFSNFFSVNFQLVNRVCTRRNAVKKYPFTSEKEKFSSVQLARVIQIVAY